MTPDEFRSIRQAAGLTQAALAELLASGLRTIKHWEGGSAAISGPAMVLMRLIQEGRYP